MKLESVWREAKTLVWQQRRRLGWALLLMLIGRLAGLVLPASSKFLIDDVLGKGERGLLLPLALAAGAATLVQAATGWGLAQLLGIAAQKQIAEMRKKLHAHVLRLPTSYFDGTKSGELISRVMTDAEGIRNLVGTGLVQLVGGLVTAALALGVLFWLNWRLTAAILGVLVLFAGMLAYAFRRLRPIFRERNKIQAEITGRLAESLGGVRVVKAYTAEKFEEEVFGGGIDRLFGNIRSTMSGIAGRDQRLDGAPRRRRRDHDGGRRTLDPRRLDDARRLHHVHLLQRPAGGAGGRDRGDRHPADRGVRRPRPHPRDLRQDDRGRRGRGAEAGREAPRRGRVRGRLVRVPGRHAGAARRLVPRRRPVRRPRSSAPRAPARAP